MHIPESIFKAYDIRGVYPNEINEDAVFAIARATAHFLDAKNMIVAMDNRSSSPDLKEAVIRGLESEGVSICDAGITTTPLFYFSVNESHADGGIMITASHNPTEYNGLKIVGRSAMPIGVDSGLKDIQTMALKEAGEPAQKRQQKTEMKTVDYLSYYIDFLTNGRTFPQIKIVADAGCGTAGTVLSAFAKRAGITLVPLCFSPCTVVAHEGNPLKDENIGDIQKAVPVEKADIGIAFDTDGDRVFFFGPDGARIPTHAVASVLAEHLLKRSPGAAVVHAVNMPHVFPETIVANGGVPVEWKVGHTLAKKIMRERDAVFGCEISGHYFFKDFFYADSGVFTLAAVLDIVARTGTPLHKLAQPYLKRFQSGELNYRVADTAEALLSLERAFPDAHTSKIDGITFQYADWWFNARPSNTEPLLRVNVEADSRELLESVRDRVEKVIRS